TIIAALRYRAQFKVSERIFAFASDAPFSSLAWLAFSGRFLRVGKRNCRRRVLAFPASSCSRAIAPVVMDSTVEELNALRALQAAGKCNACRMSRSSE